MGWKINFGDTTVDLDDLAPEVFDEIAAEGVTDDPDTSWWSVYSFPGANTSRLYRVICAAAKHADIDPPPKPTRVADTDRLLDMVEKTIPLGDKSYVDGNPPMADGPEGRSPSTSPAGTDGPKMSADDNLSVTS